MRIKELNRDGIDLIYAKDGTTWVKVGEIGPNSLTQSIEFKLPSTLYDDVTKGLKVKIDPVGTQPAIIFYSKVCESFVSPTTQQQTFLMSSLGAVETVHTPIPGSLLLLGSGIVGLAGFRFWRS